MNMIRRKRGNEIDLFQIMLDSGIVVKLVLVLLVIGSILSWAIIFSKYRQIKEAEENNEYFLDVYRRCKNFKEIAQESKRIPFSPYREMFVHGHAELTRFREQIDLESGKLAEHFRDFGFGAIERALKNGANESNIELDRKLSVLASIGSISPFIGLFGTVWGIIDSFTGLASGGATLNAVAPGIAEALVATAIGLAVAIPAVWFFNYFSNRNSTLNSEMENFGQDFLNTIERMLARK